MRIAPKGCIAGYGYDIGLYKLTDPDWFLAFYGTQALPNTGETIVLGFQGPIGADNTLLVTKGGFRKSETVVVESRTAFSDGANRESRMLQMASVALTAYLSSQDLTS